MSNAANRRQLVQNDIEEFDCCLTFDVNEYCIEWWPDLTFKNRQSVWATLQNDEDFDWSAVEETIDDFIIGEFGPKKKVVEDTEEETDEEFEDSSEKLDSVLRDYLFEFWDDIDQEEDEVIDDLVAHLVTTIDEAVDAYFTDDEETEDEPDDEDESND